MRGVIAVLLVACAGAPPPAPQPAVTAQPPPSNAAIAEPVPPPPATRTPDPLSREETILFRRGRPYRGDLTVELRKRSDLWDPCVRDVLQERDAATRNAIGDALTGYEITCDRGAGKIYISPPQGPNAQPSNAIVGLAGVLGGGRTEIVLRVIFVGTRPDPFERITLIAGAQRWTSPNLPVEHEQGFETAAIPLSPTVMRMVRRMLDEEDVRVRFETATSYDEILVTHQMQTDMRVLLDALNL